ncbi:uncharacterized protein LOC130263224 [Oenanthe melanoleuca]|uniref:uncharacterized protein LOC130263224 n=1 Tax=Oenanthe melanoleuca TaxID=2939378 RepID=UPI0024C18D28|nr:uncharacterized protein LOC130263224 [Oenanthe melanoleuca]
MAGDTGMAGKVALLLWAQTVFLAGATQLLVQPPWTPAVLWDRVTLTCQGSGTAGDTLWYKEGRRWEPEGRDSFTVTESGSYSCERPRAGFSPRVTVSDGERGFGCPHPGTLGDTKGSRWAELHGSPPGVTRASSISAASAPPAPCGPQPPSCTASTGTGSRWGARRGPRSSWCPPWGSPTRGITAARCAPRGEPCGRAAPGSASRCACPWPLDTPGAQVGSLGVVGIAGALQGQDFYSGS